MTLTGGPTHANAQSHRRRTRPPRPAYAEPSHAAQDGEELDDDQPVLNFGTYAELSRLLSAKNLELLETIAEHEPTSIREAADLVDRDYKQVYRNLDELEDIGVIEFDGGGSGQAKQPQLAYEGLEIDIPFPASSEHREAAAP